MSFGHAWLLLLLPLAALPWRRRQGAPQGYSSLARLPVDAVSGAISNQRDVTTADEAGVPQRLDQTGTELSRIEADHA